MNCNNFYYNVNKIIQNAVNSQFFHANHSYYWIFKYQAFIMHFNGVIFCVPNICVAVFSEWGALVGIQHFRNTLNHLTRIHQTTLNSFSIEFIGNYLYFNRYLICAFFLYAKCSDRRSFNEYHIRFHLNMVIALKPKRHVNNTKFYFKNKNKKCINTTNVLLATDH